MKRPAFQFYPADWRKDNQLQSCSLAAQGFWMNAMCIAHECEPYGHLVLNGKPMQPHQLGKLIGVSAKDADKLIKELEQHGVVSRCENGCLFSRRMVRDERLRQARASGGDAGAGHGKKGGRPPKGERIENPLPDTARGFSEKPLTPSQNNPPASSSSSSASAEKEKKPDLRSGKERRATRFPTDFEITDAHRKQAAALGINVKHEFEKFRDDALAKGKKFEVWTLAFTNWIRRAKEFGASSGSQQPIDYESLIEQANRRESANA